MERHELIKCCQLGNLDSFGDLYQLYKKRAFGTAYLISNKKGIAEDIVQEAFIECLKGIKGLKHPEAFDVWFYKILVRTGWRMIKEVNHVVPMDSTDMEGLNNPIDLNFQLDDIETNMLINEALETLSMPLKTVVILYYFNNLTIEEISKVLQCFQGTVKSRLYNARKQLYQVLREEESDNQAGQNTQCERKGYSFNGKNA